MAIRLDYYHSTTDFVRYLYYRVPKILFEAAELRGVTFDARMFFIFLLDRTSLSALNGWIDETGRVYIFYTLKAAMWLTGYGHNRVVRIFNELEEAGLIERVHQGLGKPMKIYVKNLFNPMDEDGNPMEYQMVSFSPSKAALEGQMSFLDAMDAAEMEAAEKESQDESADTMDNPAMTTERTSADQKVIDAASETVPEAEDAPETVHPVLRESYAEISLSPEETAEQTASPCHPCETEEPAMKNDVENVDNFSTIVENSPAESDASAASGGSSPFMPSDMGKSGHPETGSLDFRKPESIKNNTNKNNFSNKNPSIHPDPEMSEPRPRIVPGPFRMNRWVNDKMDEIKRCREEVRFQIGYEDIRASAPMSEPVLKEVVELIVGVLCSRWEYININRQPLPVTVVQEQFELLNKEHIQYVLECMNRSRTKILNPRAYILTSLYNAPNTIQSYYDAKVRHDMAQPSWYETPYSRRAS